MKKTKSKRSSISWSHVAAILLLLFAAYSLVSILTYDPSDHSFYASSPNQPVLNKGGLIGAHIAFHLRFWFGQSAYLLPALFFLWAGSFFAEQIPKERFIKGVGLLFLLSATSTLFGLSAGSDSRFTAGGLVGYFASTRLEHYCGASGSFIITVFSILIGLTISTDFLMAPWLVRFWMFAWAQLNRLFDALSKMAKNGRLLARPVLEKIEARIDHRPKSGEHLKDHATIPPKVRHYQPAEDIAKHEADQQASKRSGKVPDSEDLPNRMAASRTRNETPSVPPAPDRSTEDDVVEKTHAAITGKLKKRQGTYEFPPLDLLDVPTRKGNNGRDLKENSETLVSTLRNFGIEVRVTEIEQGPVITRYELLPAPGVKVQSISTLQDDLALALRARSIRVLAPIPGKAAVGIEIPNSEAHTVSLRELIACHELKSKRPKLPLLLGRHTSGKPLISDLGDMPHLLIAGTTGSGKTVSLNGIITGLLYFLSPDDLKFIMIDPKMVELATYSGLPHMLSPVVTDPKKAAATLNWVVSEMESRYKLLAERGVRNIHSFNAAGLKQNRDLRQDNGSETIDHMPYIVVVIDELADLMMIVQDKVEAAIARLAQLSRAVGIHLILATQRPSVDVITGVIKANFPARISFKVASKIDSRTVLDANGADQLLGRGDMLFLEPGEPAPKRGQAPWISDAEISRVVGFYKSKATPEYVSEIHEIQSSAAKPQTDASDDEMYEPAVQVVLDTGIASVSHLQRRLRLGYSRAARLIDTMEAEGIVGPPQGSKPREILRKIDS